MDIESMENAIERRTTLDLIQFLLTGSSGLIKSTAKCQDVIS